MTLYEITGKFLELLEMAEMDDADPEVIEMTMDGIDGDFEFKADGYAKVLAEINANVDGLKKEIARLTNRKRTLEASADRMKKHLQDAMTVTGKKKFKTDLFSFAIKKNPPSLVMDTDSLEDIPPYWLIQKEPEVNKAAIKEALKNGEDVGGIAHLAQGESLVIR